MSESSAKLKEQEYVHDVYQQIATHFSDTRYKPWPIVEKYLKEQKPGSIGLDIGCGNGKYLHINDSLYIIGSDRSSELATIANKEKKAEAFVSDALDLPFPSNRFDFAISIAVIHHFSTRERRIEAVKTILSRLHEGGTALIYVWALEQKNSRRGWDEGMDQDVMVPWVLQKRKKGVKEVTEEDEKPKEPVVWNRYYHLYKKGELEEDVLTVNGKVVESGYERDNWWAIISK